MDMLHRLRAICPAGGGVQRSGIPVCVEKLGMGTLIDAAAGVETYFCFERSDKPLSKNKCMDFLLLSTPSACPCATCKTSAI